MAKYIETFDLYTKYHKLPINERALYDIFFVFVHTESPGSWTLVEVYARNSVEAYIAVLDMGYTPVDELQYDLLW
jgi:hypothetical protein